MVAIKLDPVPPNEAIAYFRQKGFAPSLQRFSYLDHWRDEHARAFVVAKATQDDVLSAIRDELDKALSEGKTLKQFQDALKPQLIKKGWWGKQVMSDPATGKLEEVQLGSMHRLRVIFDTNMRTARAAGNWARIERTKRFFPYLEYKQIERPSKRDAHKPYHGIIRPVEDPIWQKIYPPNGYFCGCKVRQLTKSQIEREGKTVSDPVTLDTEEWANPRTGLISDLPLGVSPGFDHNPGMSWIDLDARWKSVTPDLSDEERTHQLGLIKGLWLRQLNRPGEKLVITRGTEVVAMREAEKETPHLVSILGLNIPEGSSLLHSHLSETPLSIADIDLLYRANISTITAISPGGSIFRAKDLRRAPDQYIIEARQYALSYQEEFLDMPLSERSIVWHHFLLRYLEQKEVLRYEYSLTRNVDEILARHIDLGELL